MNHGVEGLNKEDNRTDTARYSSEKEMLLKYMDSNSERMWSEERMVELSTWFRRICALLNLDGGKKYEVLVLKCRDRFLITGKNCWRRSSLSNFEVCCLVEIQVSL